MLKNDLPITNFDEDKLDRQKFALHLRKIIKNYQKTDCLTLGIMGSWGSGKTSFINMVFDQSNENILTEDCFKVMRFNPWNFSKQQDLYNQFFEQLIDILISNENEENEIKNIKSSINNYLMKIKHGQWEEIKYNLWKKVKHKIWDKFRYNTKISFSIPRVVSYSKFIGEKPLKTLKEEINEILKNRSYKLIIVIDDIDRLTDDEVQQIFILVKALADFQNIIYILSFDRNIILNSMGNLQKDYGEEFLDKIIQLQIDIPKISKLKVRNIFKKELDELLKNEKIDLNFEQNHLLSSLSFLSNIRDVNRYINNLTFYLPLMKGEINTVDYVLLIGLQLFENKIYHELKNNKTFFTKNLVKKPDKNTLSKYNGYFKDIIDKRETLDEEDLIRLLKGLFPQLSNFDQNIDMSNQFSSWTSDLKICSYKMFNKYFELTIDENEISYSYFIMIIQSEDYDFIKKEVLKIDAEGKSGDFLEKLSTNASKIDSKNIKLFLRLLFEIGEDLDFKNEDIIFSKIIILVQNLAILSNRFNNGELYDAMHYAIKNAETGLHLLVYVLADFDQQNQRYRFKNQKHNYKRELTDEQLDKLEKLVCIKIKRWANHGNLFEVNNPLEVIYNWYFWDNDNYCNFIEKTLKDDIKLINFIMIFIDNSFIDPNFVDLNFKGSRFIDPKFVNLNYFIDSKKDNSKINYTFNFSIMEEICPVNIIYNRINNITPKLPEGDIKKMCECFIEKYQQI